MIRKRHRRHNPTRPAIARGLPVETFRSYYWYRDELEKCCRDQGLDSSGQKLDMVRRIEIFLRTGRRGDRRSRRAPRSRPPERSGPLRLDTLVTFAFRCNAQTRAFFESVIGKHFHFTAHLQQFRRRKHQRGIKLTYGDLAREWIAEHERRKDTSYKPRLGRSGEYNQFVRDFLADKKRNADKSIRDAAKGWNRLRVHRGRRTYAEYRRLL